MNEKLIEEIEDEIALCKSHAARCKTEIACEEVSLMAWEDRKTMLEGLKEIASADCLKSEECARELKSLKHRLQQLSENVDKETSEIRVVKYDIGSPDYFCQYCNAELSLNCRYCYNCGRELIWDCEGEAE